MSRAPDRREFKMRALSELKTNEYDVAHIKYASGGAKVITIFLSMI